MSDNKIKAKPKDEILPTQKQKVDEVYGPSVIEELLELLNDQENYRW